MTKMTRLRIVTAFGVLGTTSSFASSFVFPGMTRSGPLSLSSIGSGAPREGLHARKSSWSVGDDWSSLSSESPENAVPNTDDIFNEDLASQAARLMEPTTTPAEPSQEDTWLSHAVDEIHNHGHVEKQAPSEPSLYDTFESYTQSIGFIDEMGHQISMLVNCNKRPEDLLIEAGRALAPLTDEERNDVSQLVTQSNDGEYHATDFFKEAVTKMYMEHARSEPTQDGGYNVFLDAAGVARWMTKCIGSETESVGRHDRRVLTTIAKFSPYGTGRLGEEDFQRLYLSAVTDFLDGKTRRASREMKMKLPTVESVWCDIRNHGILSPVEAEQKRKADEIRAEYGAASAAETKVNAKGLATLMDECEIVEWLEDSKASSFTTRTTESSNDESQRRKKSSHEILELASDDKTPLRMRDGDFGKTLFTHFDCHAFSIALTLC